MPENFLREGGGHHSIKSYTVGAIFCGIIDSEYSTARFLHLAQIGSGLDGISYKVVAVNLNWNGDEWNWNANDFDNGNDWNAGNVLLFFETVHVFTKSLPSVYGGVLFFSSKLRSHIIFPSAKHSSHLADLQRDIGVTRILDKFIFPGNLEKIFQKVSLIDSAHDKRIFIFNRRIVRLINGFEQI